MDKVLELIKLHSETKAFIIRVQQGTLKMQPKYLPEHARFQVLDQNSFGKWKLNHFQGVHQTNPDQDKED